MSPTTETHWNQIFSSKSEDQLGWYEKEATQTLEFLADIQWPEDAVVFLPGAVKNERKNKCIKIGKKLPLTSQP